jgi:hypothetical protein
LLATISRIDLLRFFQRVGCMSADYGPTFAAEKLAAEHGFGFSSETLRKWMIEDELWVDRKQRQKRVHQPRPRRDCGGELVQVDGSEYCGSVVRRPRAAMHLDGATNRLMHLYFVESESTSAYFHAARAYLEAWGKSVAFYSHKHGVFRVNHPGALGDDGMPSSAGLCTRSMPSTTRPTSPRSRNGSATPTRQHRHHPYLRSPQNAARGQPDVQGGLLSGRRQYARLGFPVRVA